MSRVKTVLAVAVTIGLIVGALYVRSTFIEGDGGGVITDGSTPASGGGGDLRVACDAMVGTACPEGAAQLDLDGLLAAFGAATVEFDMIVAPSVVVEFIEQSQTSRARFDPTRDVVATTPLVLAVAVSRDEVMADTCADRVTWSCLAGLVQGGQLQPSFGAPQSSSEGLLAVAALTGGFFDDPRFSTNVLGGSGFLGWVDALNDQSQFSPTPVQRLIQFNGAQNDSAVAIEAVGYRNVERAAQNRPELFWPTPLAYVQVVAVAVGGADVGDVQALGREVGEALAEAGWRGPDGGPVTDGPPLDLQDDGLPSGGTLFALRERLGS
ncbi:MAG: hypothetical protein ACR2HR_08860 [Euzebya sp.]